jgi:hypothetical protein
MANANITKIGVTEAVAIEKAAEAEAPAAAPVEAPAPNISERRVVGRREVPTPYGHTIIVENL